MNIVFITQYQDLYGANKSLVNLLLCLKARGYHILVVCPSKGDMTDYLNENEIQNISRYKFWGWEYKNLNDFLKMPYRLFRSGLSVVALIKMLKSFNPDIIYSNSSVIWIGKVLSSILKKPHVWHVREFGLEDYGLRMLGGRFLCNYLMNRSDAVISISKAIDKDVLYNIKKELKHQVYNGVVPESEISTQSKTLVEGKNLIFCMAGRLMPSKGFKEAIHAMKIVAEKYPKTRLYIAGKGEEGDDYEKELHLLVKKLGLQKQIIFLGYVKDIRPLFLNSDCLLMCSKAEGLGRVTIEAMACGTPVIGHNSGATPEVVKHKYNGYLYNHGSEELAECMIRMMNSKRYQQLSKNAITTVKKNFSIESYTDKMEKILHKVLQTSLNKKERVMNG